MGKEESGITSYPPNTLPVSSWLYQYSQQQDLQPIDPITFLLFLTPPSPLFLLFLAGLNSLLVVIIIPLQNWNMDWELVNMKESLLISLCNNSIVVIVLKSPSLLEMHLEVFIGELIWCLEFSLKLSRKRNHVEK